MDSNTAVSIASRSRIGRVRHLEARYLWLQDSVKKGQVELMTVPLIDNVADVLTKPTSYDDMRRLIKGIGGNIGMRESRPSWADLSGA